MHLQDAKKTHITTRQNIQFNWPKLEDVPDILAELAHQLVVDLEPACSVDDHGGAPEAFGFRKVSAHAIALVE